MAEITEIATHIIRVGTVKVILLCCITKSEVTKIYAAQPFILIVQQIGNTKRDVLLFTLRLVSADSIDTQVVCLCALMAGEILGERSVPHHIADRDT